VKGNTTVKDLKGATLLGAIYQRLNLLAQDIALMRIVTLDNNASPPTKRTFKSLRGVWRGLNISEDDIEKAQVSLPNEV